MSAVARLVERPIDVTALIVEASSPDFGANSVFIGTVRDVNDGRAVTGIDYTAYSTMAQLEMQRIAGEALQAYPGTRIVIEHRIGYLALGEASIAIVAANARRSPSLEALRFLIEEIKKRVPIWKREHYADGTREWVDPTGSTMVPVP